MQISKPSLDTKDTGGAVGQPVYAGNTVIISTKTADMKDSDTDINQTYKNDNYAKKFEYPQVKQTVPEKGNNQYM